jgi:hypothetical protein
MLHILLPNNLSVPLHISVPMALHHIYLTCIILSSETEQITHGSFGFHEKSEIFAVCPPWMNCEKYKN